MRPPVSKYFSRSSATPRGRGANRSRKIGWHKRGTVPGISGGLTGGANYPIIISLSSKGEIFRERLS